MLNFAHYLGFILTLVLTAAVGVYSLRYVKTAADFSVGGRGLTYWLVTGSIVGSFVGGTSTIGTAEVAYTLGISGIWFTLGAGLSCFVMALLVRPLREAQVDTIPQFLAQSYSGKVVTWSTIYISLGMFIQIIAQILAAVPLLRTLININSSEAAGVFTLLLIVYILFGGFWGTSLVGLFKTFLLYISLGFAGVYCLTLVKSQEVSMANSLLVLFPHGIQTEFAAVFSVVVGFVSTQTYMQAIFSGRDANASRKGVVFAGILIPLIGVLSVYIGMFMRMTHPEIDASLALPLFIITYLPSFIGGVVLAAIFISLVMTGSSLALGIATMLSQDIYKRIFKPALQDQELVKASRVLIIFITAIALGVVSTNFNTLILKWAFLSMALRGVTVFMPLLAAIFLKGRIQKNAATLAIAIAPISAVIWSMWRPINVDPLYIGFSISMFFMIIGFFKRKTLLKFQQR